MHSHRDHQHSDEVHDHNNEGHAHIHTADTHCCSATNTAVEEVSQASKHSHSSNCCSSAKPDTSGNDSELEGLPSTGGQRYSWHIKGMDCPSCARKIENAVGGISGVEQARCCLLRKSWW